MATSRRAWLVGVTTTLIGARLALGETSRRADHHRAAPHPPNEFEELSIRVLQERMSAGLSAAALVKRQLFRIREIDPALCSLIAVDSGAVLHAKSLDQERAHGLARGPLHGITISVKDIIDVRGMPTTAGSLALRDNLAIADATAVSRLRAAGAIIIAKANTAEWANARASQSLGSWSAVGGYSRNPYAFDRTAGGSSSGSGSSVAAGLVTASLGEDTRGSIISPASVNGLVGLRPTVGLIPRSGGIPFNRRQDTFGPICRYVEDAAILLTVLAGSDDSDPYSLDADTYKQDYAAHLNANSLRGARIGVARFAVGSHPGTTAIFETSLALLRDRGALLVDIPRPQNVELALSPHGSSESHATYDEYLRSRPPQVKVRSLAELVTFNALHADKELMFYGQDILESSAALDSLPATEASNRVADERRQRAREQLDGMLKGNNVESIIAPSGPPAGKLDLVGRPATNGPVEISLLGLAAQAAYPMLTVPMGEHMGMPVGLSFTATAWSEARLLDLGYAFEQASKARRPPTFAKSIEELPENARALSPQRL